MTTQREKIVDHVWQMIITMGIKAVRMDDVANVMGMSKRTLYEMFGDKEGLLYLAMERYSEHSASSREDAPGAQGACRCLRQCSGDGVDMFSRDIQPMGHVGVAPDEQYEEVLPQDL